LKIQSGGGLGRHLENHNNRDISATVLPIFTKFGAVVQNGSLNREKSKMADSCHYENR